MARLRCDIGIYLFLLGRIDADFNRLLVLAAKGVVVNRSVAPLNAVKLLSALSQLKSAPLAHILTLCPRPHRLVALDAVSPKHDFFWLMVKPRLGLSVMRREFGNGGRRPF